MFQKLGVLDRIRELEAELEQEIAGAQRRRHYTVEAGRVRFEEPIITRWHCRLWCSTPGCRSIS